MQSSEEEVNSELSASGLAGFATTTTVAIAIRIRATIFILNCKTEKKNI
jgi:hypothetical protein